MTIDRPIFINQRQGRTICTVLHLFCEIVYVFYRNMSSVNRDDLKRKENKSPAMLDLLGRDLIRNTRKLSHCYDVSKYIVGFGVMLKCAIGN